MPLPEKRSENVFSDFKAPLSAGAAVTEAHRCLFCYDPPCKGSCPAAIDVSGFIHKIATGNLKGAARTVFAANPLGMSCARVCPTEVLCAGSCVLPKMGLPAIQIGKLQRYVTDLAFSQKWNLFERAPDTGKRVALVGAGPSSLACARELARMGHSCTIFEKRDLPGGLNTMGIAPYKMKADRALEEVDWFVSIGGIELALGEEVGFDVTFEELEAKFDAVFLGMGLGEDRWLHRLPGHDHAGIHGATEFIATLKTSELSLSGVTHAAVLGGGNTAIDAVRELLVLGVPNITLVYRRSEADMPGYAHEWKVAVQQGAKASWRTVPTGFEGRDGVCAIRCMRVDKDLKPTDETFAIPAQLVLLAVGQEGVGDRLKGLPGITVKDGVIVVDERRFTGRPRWYAGGDCVNGGKEVVNAAADGLAAARAIHADLTR